MASSRYLYFANPQPKKYKHELVPKIARHDCLGHTTTLPDPIRENVQILDGAIPRQNLIHLLARHEPRKLGQVERAVDFCLFNANRPAVQDL